MTFHGCTHDQTCGAGVHGDQIFSMLQDVQKKKTEYSLLLTMKGGLLNQIIAAWVGRVGMPSKSF